MTKREKALAIVDNYSVYHAGTAIVVGSFGGQFGVDSVALTALTVKMIEEICNVYGIRDRSAKNIHIASAIARLTYKGTVIAKTILNWLPLGSVANGATTYFLTRSAGMKCIEEIENEKMNVKSQIIQGVKDTSVILVKSEMFDGIESVSDSLTENAVDRIKDTLQCDISKDLGLDSIISYLDKIPTEATAGIDKAVVTALRATIAECLKGDAKQLNTAEILSKTIFATLTAMLDEHTRMSEAEIQFRIMANDEHYKTFETFLHNTAEHYDQLERERGRYEALKYCISGISDGCKIYFGLTSKDMLNEILKNPYDDEIETVYNSYLPLVTGSDNYASIWAKTSVIYRRLMLLNVKYNVPNIRFDKLDDKLIYMIAGRVKEKSQILADMSVESVAYHISEFISNHCEYFSLQTKIPIVGYDSEIKQREYKRVCDICIGFWAEIAKGDNTEKCVWVDGFELYRQLFHLRLIFKDGNSHLYKDDELIYHVAEIMKPKVALLSKYSVEEIAYFISESFDRYNMASSI